MKRIILVTLLVSILSLLIGCDGPKNATTDLPKEDLVKVVSYDEDDEKEIFGDLNDTEIKDIIEEIFERVSNDEYEVDKKDSIIEQVFKESGIKDEHKINAAKSKIIISK